MPSDEMETEDVLDRGEFESKVRGLRHIQSHYEGTDEQETMLLAHDAAQRARIEALEAEREEKDEALRQVYMGANDPENVKEIAHRALEES